MKIDWSKIYKNIKVFGSLLKMITRPLSRAGRRQKKLLILRIRRVMLVHF